MLSLTGKMFLYNIIRKTLFKKIHTYLLFAAIFISLASCAQTRAVFDTANVQGTKSNSAFAYVSFIPGVYSFMDADILGNIYLINEQNQLKKIKPNGDSAAIYNDVKKFGNPSLIDVTNPLKIPVYYKNYSTVVVLDRFLTYRNSINFRKENIFKVKTLATSYDNNLWIFDEQDFKLKKINDEGLVLRETNDWRQIFDTVPTPSLIIDRENFVYLYDENRGFYIFDYYGSFKTHLPFSGWQHVAVASGRLMGFVKDTLYSYELNTFSLKSYSLPPFFSDYIDIKAVNGKVYLLKKNGVEIYNIL